MCVYMDVCNLVNIFLKSYHAQIEYIVYIAILAQKGASIALRIFFSGDVFATEPTVHKWEVIRGRVNGCDYWCYT